LIRFIHIPKNGGTSISKFLRKNGIEYLYGDGNQDFTDIVVSRHNNASYWANENSFKFCVVRNPYHRLVSFYNWTTQVRELPDWETFVKKQMTNARAKNSWKLQVDWIYNNSYNKLYVDKIFKLEDLQQLKDYFNIKTKIPHLNKSTKKHYDFYYKNNEIKDIVYERFIKDFELLGYEY
jgi:hypothetical protein